MARKKVAPKKTTVSKTQQEERKMAADAAKKYRDRLIEDGYSSLQVWVPDRYKSELREIVHARVEELLALEEMAEERKRNDQNGVDRLAAIRPRRNRNRL